MRKIKFNPSAALQQLHVLGCNILGNKELDLTSEISLEDLKKITIIAGNGEKRVPIELNNMSATKTYDSYLHYQNKVGGVEYRILDKEIVDVLLRLAQYIDGNEYDFVVAAPVHRISGHEAVIHISQLFGKKRITLKTSFATVNYPEIKEKLEKIHGLSTYSTTDRNIVKDFGYNGSYEFTLTINEDIYNWADLIPEVIDVVQESFEKPMKITLGNKLIENIEDTIEVDSTYELFQHGSKCYLKKKSLPLESYDVSKRVLDALRNLGCELLEDVTGYTYSELREKTSLGVISLLQLEEVLESNSLSFKKRPFIDSSNSSTNLESISFGGLGSRMKNLLNNAGIQTAQDFIGKSYREVLKIGGLGKASFASLESYLGGKFVKMG